MKATIKNHTVEKRAFAGICESKQIYYEFAERFTLFDSIEEFADFIFDLLLYKNISIKISNTSVQ